MSNNPTEFLYSKRFKPYRKSEEHSYCKSSYIQTLDTQQNALSDSSSVCNESTATTNEMEMTCESFEEQYSSSGCWEEPSLPSATFQPSIVSITSLMPACSRSQSSPNSVVPTFVEQQALSPAVSEVSIKEERINLDCYVLLERLPERLVRTAATSPIFVPDWSIVLVSSASAANALFSTETLKSEPDDIGALQYEEQLAGPCDAMYQNSAVTSSDWFDQFDRPVDCAQYLDQDLSHDRVFVNRKFAEPDDTESLQCEEQLAGPYDVCQNSTITSHASHPVETGQHPDPDHDRPPGRVSVSRKSVSRKTTTAAAGANRKAAAKKSPGAANTVPDRVERDISVIVLNSAQRARNVSSDAAGAQSLDISRLVLSTLQQRKINSLPPVNSDSCAYVIPDENRQSAVSHPTEATNELRKMLHQSRMEQVATAVKLNREEAKVRYLLKEVESLKKTVTQLTSVNSLNSSCAPVNSSA